MTQELLNAKIEAYYEARAEYDRLKALSDAADRVRRDRERELVDYMIENQIKKVSLADGTTPLLVQAISCSVTQENYDDIREWLRNSVGDDADFIVTIPHKPTILEHIKKLVKEGDDPADFPAFLKVDTRPTLRVDGWKGRG